MADILLDAHGGWNPASKPAYALVPKDSRLLYFTDNLRLFLDSDQARSQLQSAEPTQVVEGFKWAQNYTVSEVGADQFITPAGMVRKTVSGQRLLCTSEECGNKGWHDKKVCSGLFSEDDYQNANIYFAACRYIELKKTGDAEYYAETGMNQPQYGVGQGAEGDVLTMEEFNRLGAEIHDSGEAVTWWTNEKDNLAEDRREPIRKYIEEQMFAGSIQLDP